MIPAVFLDTNILLDHLTGGQPFSKDAARIIALAEKGKINAYISLLSMHIVFYLLRKINKDHSSSKLAIQALCKICKVIQTNDPLVVKQALESDFNDVEDAIQYFTAKEETTISIFISRDARGFKNTDILVLTPKEFLASI